MGLPDQLLLFDGECAMCDATVQWVLDHDRQGVFSFAPLQGPTAKEIRARHPELPPTLDSLILVRQTPRGEEVRYHSDAVLGLARGLGGAWRLAAALKLLPRFLRDPWYRMLARNRYRLFGKLEGCRVPQPHEAARFLP
jgi:predicted DCC family thiol-disulfide oxidoreductase YuxK